MKHASRLQIGPDLYAVVPASRARAVAYVLTLGADTLRHRDGVHGLDWLGPLLDVLRQVDSEQQCEPPARSSGSPPGTEPRVEAVEPALWAHDQLLIAEAQLLTGWSRSYLCRLARTGLGVKRGGVWHLDRGAVLALHRDPRADDPRGGRRDAG